MSPQAALRPILLIEDNPMDIDLTLRAFAKRQLANPIEVVEDGEAAMARIDQWEQGLADTPSLILLDLKLPKVDGLDVLRRLKASLKLRVIAVVVLTTSAEDRDVQLAYELGANSYIVKPVSFDKFLQVAEQIELYWGLLNQPCT
jgi:CheY-like chemotaxis protein